MVHAPLAGFTAKRRKGLRGRRIHRRVGQVTPVHNQILQIALTLVVQIRLIHLVLGFILVIVGFFPYLVD